MKYTVEKLVDDLTGMNITRGDTLLVHSGFRTINAETPLHVIKALQTAIGEAGTLVMPSFPGGSEFFMVLNGIIFDVRTSKTDCGLIPETFRKQPGVRRSLNPGHCMAAWGKNAASILNGHEKCRVSAGKGSPFEKIINARGKILLIGTDNTHNTTLHYVENVHGAPTVCAKEFYPAIIDENGKKLLVPTFPHMPGLPRDYGKVESILIENGIQRNTRFGDAEARIIDAYKMNELIGGLIEKDRTFLIPCFNPENMPHTVLP